MEPLLSGAAAGFAVAIPVGAIALLIIELGLRRGFRIGAAAGAGAATADGVYASVAGLAGTALATAISPIEVPLRLLSVIVLVALAVRGLVGSVRGESADTPTSSPPPLAMGRTYAQFLALTLLNPTTIVYFAALILGLRAANLGGASVAAFVIGAFVASLAVQWTYAGLGALGHRRLSPRGRAALGVVGDVVILALAARIGIELL